jgi:hypothetical protein
MRKSALPFFTTSNDPVQYCNSAFFFSSYCMYARVLDFIARKLRCLARNSGFFHKNAKEVSLKSVDDDYINENNFFHASGVE